MIQSSTFDARSLREALGSFATGVTVITARAADGAPVGVTANSFSSVSLDPPMVLWSLARDAASRPAFEQASHFAVHVLTAEQDALSARFARRGTDKFAGLPLIHGLGGAPLLENCAARFQCATAFTYDGGDHLIFVGEVLSLERTAAAPLVFHAGRYAWATPRSAEAPRLPQLASGFDEHFLGYLMGRAHFQFYRSLRRSLDQAGLEDDPYFLLSTLSVHDGLSADALETAIGHCLAQPAAPTLRRLVARGLLVADAGDSAGFCLSASGRALMSALIAAAKAEEARMVAQLGVADSALLRTVLHRLVTLTDPGKADVWTAATPSPA